MRKSLYRRHNQVFLGLLRRYREQGRFRQRDLAQHLGSGQGTVSKAETGNRRLDVIELREWLMAMGVDFLEFMAELHEQLEASSLQLDPWSLHGPGDASVERADSVSSDGSVSAARALTQAAQVLFDKQVEALTLTLIPAMRAALRREVTDTLAELDRDQQPGRILARWIGLLKAGHKDAATLLQPGEAEIVGHARDMANVMLSNWMGLLAHCTPVEVRVRLAAVRCDPSELPGEVLNGCLAWPIPQPEAKALLVAFLGDGWSPERVHDWASVPWAGRAPLPGER